MVESTQFADDHLPLFFGVDAQYFSAALLPDPDSTAAAIDRAVALRVGQIEEQRKTLTNTTFRIISKATTIEAGRVFRREVTTCSPARSGPRCWRQYEMQGLVYYGWPISSWVAVPMTRILDFFYWLVHNYGLAIIMLTVVVRLAMFPMSRKQAQNAQMMQKIQPEMKEIQKKFKKDPEAARKAQQELWAKHNYNPLGGCLPLFIQMPIFLGLYRALQVNVELRDAPLISHAIRWCSNLAAPDMLFDWSGFMPDAVNNGIGFPWFPLAGTDVRFRPLLEPVPHHHACAVPDPAEGDDAAGGRRTGGPAAEDHEVRHVLHGPDVLQGGRRAVHLLHRLDALGTGRAAVPAQDWRRRAAIRAKTACRAALCRSPIAPATPSARPFAARNAAERSKDLIPAWGRFTGSIFLYGW